jgi:SpoIVB peptidase S55
MDVQMRQKATRRPTLIRALIQGATLVLCSATAATAQLSSALPANPPPSSAGFFPLEQVHRGLHGVAYTVFEGTQPEPMEVEILGILRNSLGPGKDMIVARLKGTHPEYTGVVAGMSGSPVYIDGKLAGALSYRIGQFSKEPIAGITPIAQMLEVRDQVETPSSQLVASMGGTAVPGNDASAAETTAVHPIETPLVFDGFGQQAVDLWKLHVPSMSMAAVGGIGGSASGQAQPEPIVPGSAVSAILVRGDLEIAATCTVTYVDAKQLLACGHPITQFGPISMPMTKAEVVATLPSPLNAFKIVNTTETVGSFNEDRQSAIRGSFGESARMIPVTLHINGGTRTQTLHLEVIDQPQITPTAVMVTVFQGLQQTNAYTAESSYRVHGTVNMTGYPQLHMDNFVAPTDAGPADLAVALFVGERFDKLYDNAARRTSVQSVELSIEAVPERRTLQLESAQSTAQVVHAGDTLTIEARLRPFHGEPRNVRIPVTLPASLPAGSLRLLLSDGATLDRLTQPQRANSVLDVAATIAQINSQHASDQLYVTLLDPSAQAVVQGRTLPSLPISMANILEPLRNNQELSLNGESAVPLTSLPVDGMLTGQQVVTIRVE